MTEIEFDTTATLDWGNLSDDFQPTKSHQEDDAKGIANVYCYDSLGTHPKAAVVNTEEATGWTSHDVLQAAAKSTGTSWWQSTVNSISNWLGISSTDKTEALPAEGSWIDYLDPRVIVSGATSMAFSL